MMVAFVVVLVCATVIGRELLVTHREALRRREFQAVRRSQARQQRAAWRHQHSLVQMNRDAQMAALRAQRQFHGELIEKQHRLIDGDEPWK